MHYFVHVIPISIRFLIDVSHLSIFLTLNFV